MTQPAYFTLPPYLIQPPLVGSTPLSPLIYDGIDPVETINYLFKKNFGIPNVYPYKPYDGDAASKFNSAICINNKNMYSQYIPSTIDLSSLQQDITWLNPTDNVSDANEGKYISTIYPYLIYYSNVRMTTTLSFNGVFSYFCGNFNNIVSTNFSKNAISFYFGDGISYNHSLKSTDQTDLPFGNLTLGGSWLLDTDSGVLTFYDNVQASIVNENNPPRISFWRYEGLTGNSGISELYELD